MSRIRGSWPGGPGRRNPEGGDPRHTPRLEGAEEIVARREAAALRRRGRKRKRRVWSLLVLAVVLAGGTGLYLGFRAHRSPEQLTDEREAERTGVQLFDLSREANRMLMELWRMEDVEAGRNRGLP